MDSLKNLIRKFIQATSAFDMRSYCNKKLPRISGIYSCFACYNLLFILLSLSIYNSLYINNLGTIYFMQLGSFTISFMFFCHRQLFIWLFSSRSLGLIWYISIFISLSLFGAWLVLVSEFSHISLIVFIMNIAMIGIILTWRTAIIMIIAGAIIDFHIYAWLEGEAAIKAVEGMRIQMVYALFAAGSLMVAILRPRSYKQDNLDEKIDYMLTKLSGANTSANDNTLHINYSLPDSIADGYAMHEAAYSLHDTIHGRRANSEEHDISLGAERLISYVDNLIDLSKISSLEYRISKSRVALSELLWQRIKRVLKIYIRPGDFNREFQINIEDNIFIEAERYYLERVLDNLIANTIQYCPIGKIDIVLLRDPISQAIYISISDESIGATISEKVDVIAGREGSLAFCLKVAELHEWQITEERMGGKGGMFKVVF